MIGPLLGFGAGYAARALGIKPLPASLIGLTVTGFYAVGGISATYTAGSWLVADVAAGATAAAGASTVVAATAAVVIPVTVGYAAATVISGETGREQLTDFLTGQVSPGEYQRALSAAHDRFDSTRSVEGNALGIPAGIPIGESGSPYYGAHIERSAAWHGMTPAEYASNLYGR